MERWIDGLMDRQIDRRRYDYKWINEQIDR